MLLRWLGQRLTESAPGNKDLDRLIDLVLVKVWIVIRHALETPVGTACTLRKTCYWDLV
jgi:hypothetical protein